MKRRTQRLIATCLVASGAVLGLWVGVSFIRAQAQGTGVDGNIPTDGVPAPANPVPPPNPVPPAEMSESQVPSSSAPPPPSPPQVQAPPLESSPQVPPSVDGNGGGEGLQGGPQDMPPPDGLGSRVTDGFVYDPGGLRDPFFPSKGLWLPTPDKPQTVASPTKQFEPPYDASDPLQKFELREYKLVAVLWDVRQPKAMVSTPDGKVWTIRQKVRLGRAGAVVAAIRESEIVVVEPNPDGSYVNASTRVISIKK